MMNTSVGEKLIEEEIAEEGSVSMRMIISKVAITTVCEYVFCGDNFQKLTGERFSDMELCKVRWIGLF